eukprot:4139323-Amphidinium_carterae.2
MNKVRKLFRPPGLMTPNVPHNRIKTLRHATCSVAEFRDIFVTIALAILSWWKTSIKQAGYIITPHIIVYKLRDLQKQEGKQTHRHTKQRMDGQSDTKT